MFRFEGRPDGAEGFWRAARPGADELEALADGTDGTATLTSDLIDGQALHAVEAEDGKEGGMFAAAFAFKAIQEDERGAGGGQNWSGGGMDYWISGFLDCWIGS